MVDHGFSLWGWLIEMVDLLQSLFYDLGQVGDWFFSQTTNVIWEFLAVFLKQQMLYENPSSFFSNN